VGHLGLFVFWVLGLSKPNSFLAIYIRRPAQQYICAPPCIIPPGKRRCRVYQIYCCEGSCVHQELLGSGLRHGDLHRVACLIRSSSSGDVLRVIGKFLSG
jgi:hypothetical protein